MEDETLRMFFDPNLNPVEFVDALFLSVTKAGDKYTPSSVKKANSMTQELMTRLDYGTSEIVTELATKLEQLRKLTGSVKSSDISHSEITTSATVESKRLEYYADVLRHSVETLSDKVEQTHAQMAPKLDSVPLETLSQLKVVDDNLSSTSKLLLNIRRTIGNVDKGAITLEKFQEQLMALQETIKSRLRDGSAEEREEMMNTIAEMKSWTPLFLPFSHFGPVYTKFINRIESDI